MTTHYPFPKIRQYHQVLRGLKDHHCFVGKDEEGVAIYDYSRELPTVTFRGTVKLHGTNAAIVFSADGNFYAQSRENIITEEKDNAGFGAWVHHKGYKLQNQIISEFSIETDKIVLFGEWCGGSIQKGVALNQLEKMFVVFGMKRISADGETEWLDCSCIKHPEIGVWNIADAPAYLIQVDLNRPDKAIEQMTVWVEAIDASCPFARMFDIEGHGEGLVFRPDGSHGYNEAFKVKGESHSKSKIKKLPRVDTEKLDGILQAVETHCHEDRLQQGWEAIVRTPEDHAPQKIADFIRWVVTDLWEEESDSLYASGIERKEMGAACSKKAARWFQAKLAASI